MRRRRHNKKQRRVIVVSVISLLCIMSAGYAAFQTNLNITAKGNIFDKGISITELKKLKVTSGDGLYDDMAESGRYVYRGSNPDNYVTFNNELWRIIGIETDNSLKIMCENNTGGAIAWDDDANPEWTTASLNKYLNETYYSSLSDDVKNFISLHSFNVGKLYLNWNEEVSMTSLTTDVSNEKRETWEGNVGVLNATDFIKSSIDTKCISARSSWLSADDMPCRNQNWIYKNGENFWTINANDPYNPKYEHNGWLIHNYMGGYGLDGTHSDSGADLMAFPVVFLKSGITLLGEGTKENPYIIK